ncbi:hypothetical protein WB66_14085 [bacteria symbiont BFo1 of Frankliniella occidentalis]|jgi:outer membrane murein-binding lipoprotein Lpp|uniref:DUF3313 domain-containing protein n=1 Tax=Erwinia aphidicola TaxID=68334 RepID=A0ABU8DAM9_ERWAP|nr:DUF3313 domain-containing protein [Erwinia aphidicola]KMV69843.1 hypothetical protein AI28_03190 [bacteria symbiont BFo1 of Frankliniella occidentalis]PIJ58510.1 DUF3313 domain-containing protein [Erwinia sp. OLMDLW33]KYP83741.1 hypothetical protein WB66_14085 [bacteria symbiont BFo1 of Frankliniella occidentalis]KYP89120.1 hypothetical protein WB91_12930 [bacteria symbiont BFo1 of Frankliniella occidentalis]MBD1374055.1 DUF3313 domain-containing protein [Erwinia aphidicola]
MHNVRIPLIAGLAMACLVLAGCSSKVADTSQYSGFLPDYSHLKPEKSASGVQTLRWVSPDYQSAKYNAIHYTPAVYYPAAKPTARVSQQTLDQIRAYLDQTLKAAVARHKPLVNHAGRGTLELKTAITAVNAENQDMKFYEVVPIAAVVASTMAASGHRTQNSVLFLEMQLVDSQTGKPVMEAVRKAYGNTVPNNNAPITLTQLKSGIDQMVSDVVNFPDK